MCIRDRVWEVDPQADPESVDPALAELGERLDAAVATTAPLTGEERRARNGLQTRQGTLR